MTHKHTSGNNQRETEPDLHLTHSSVKCYQEVIYVT